MTAALAQGPCHKLSHTLSCTPVCTAAFSRTILQFMTTLFLASGLKVTSPDHTKTITETVRNAHLSGHIPRPTESEHRREAADCSLKTSESDSEAHSSGTHFASRLLGLHCVPTPRLRPGALLLQAAAQRAGLGKSSWCSEEMVGSVPQFHKSSPYQPSSGSNRRRSPDSGGRCSVRAQTLALRLPSM